VLHFLRGQIVVALVWWMVDLICRGPFHVSVQPSLRRLQPCELADRKTRAGDGFNGITPSHAKGQKGGVIGLSQLANSADGCANHCCVPIPHAHMTTGAATVVVGDLHLTLTCIAASLELDPCLPNRNSVVPFVSLFGSSN